MKNSKLKIISSLPAWIAVTALFSLIVSLRAGSRTSLNYSSLTESVDDGGKHVSSAAYTHEGSIGGITGISTVASPSETAKDTSRNAGSPRSL